MSCICIILCMGKHTMSWLFLAMASVFYIIVVSYILNCLVSQQRQVVIVIFIYYSNGKYMYIHVGRDCFYNYSNTGHNYGVLYLAQLYSCGPYYIGKQEHSWQFAFVRREISAECSLWRMLK